MEIRTYDWKKKNYQTNRNIKYEGDFINDKSEKYGKYILEYGEYYIDQ